MTPDEMFWYPIDKALAELGLRGNVNRSVGFEWRREIGEAVLQVAGYKEWKQRAIAAEQQCAELKAALAFVVEAEVGRGKCYGLPDGDCVGVGCMHDADGGADG